VDDELEIRELRASDVEALIACVRRCYGESYADPSFYDAAALRAQLASGRLVSRVAVAPDGRVVGHLGTRRARPGEPVAETVGGIVEPEQRGRGLLRRIGGEMNRVYSELRIAGVRLFATTAHSRTQNLIAAAGGVVTGVLLAHIPAETEYHGIEPARGASRFACVVCYQALTTAPSLRVHLPDEVAEIAGSVYADLALAREFVRAPAGGIAAIAGSIARNPQRGSRTLRLGALAEDGEPRFASLDEALRDADEAVVYADVPLASRAAPGVAAALHERGFFFGALLPGSTRSETLRLQRLSPSVELREPIAVAAPQGQRVLAQVLGGWRTAKASRATARPG
jgi:hypothetical protein